MSEKHKTVYWIYVAVETDHHPGCVIQSIINYAAQAGVSDLCTMNTETLRACALSEYPKGEILIGCGVKEVPIAGTTVFSDDGKPIGWLDNLRPSSCLGYPAQCNKCEHKHPETGELILDKNGIHVMSQTFYCDLLKKTYTEKAKNNG